MGPGTRASVAKRRPGYPLRMFQDEAYRRAEPTAIVEPDGVGMGGPGGAPQEQLSAVERHDANR